MPTVPAAGGVLWIGLAICRRIAEDVRNGRRAFAAGVNRVPRKRLKAALAAVHGHSEAALS